jgi:hypothetical protein
MEVPERMKTAIPLLKNEKAAPKGAAFGCGKRSRVIFF